MSRDLSVEFSLAGWRVVDVEPSRLDLASIRSLVDSVHPAAFVGINHSPELAWAVTREGVGYISWTVDPLGLDRLRVIEGTRTDLVHPFLHRSSQVPLFRSLGFPSASWLPLAAPRRRLEDDPNPPDPGGLPPSFVGSSLGDEIELFRRAASHWGWSPEIVTLVESSLEPLVDVALANLDFPGISPDGRDLPRNLLELAGDSASVVAEAVNALLAARFRRRRVAELAVQGVSVHGDPGWEPFAGVAWKGALADGAPLTHVYRNSLANLDVPRLHQRDIATLRAFDVAACGGCLVAEPSTDLCRLFVPGEEFLPYRDGSQLREQLERVGRDRALALEIGRKARRRVLAEHTLERRTTMLLEAVASFG